MTPSPTLWRLFLVFFVMGATSIGGGVVGYLRSGLVVRQRWLDDMAFVELLLNLERTFGLKVAVEELEIENFRSIRKIADFVMARDASSRPFPG